jgi:hypothetical protein
MNVGPRLLRGYGPLAVFAVMLVLMAVLVPSKVPSARSAATTAGAGTPGAAASGPAPTTGAGPAATVAGTGTPAAAGGGAAPSAAGPAATAAAGRCSGRQVPGDPYSPPCATWAGTNGGSTSKGVTGNQIVVAYRITNDQSFQQTLAQLAGASLEDTQADVERTITALAQYFNSHYQFYGRKITVRFYTGQGSLANELVGNGQAQAEADAVTVGQQIKAFADLSAESEPYADALFRQGVMGFGDPYMSQHWHQQHAPYDWSIAADGTKVASFAAEYEVQKLCPAGSPAAYAGGNLKNKPRKFATLAPDNSWYQESVQVARGIASQAGCDPGENVEYQLDLGTMSNQASNIIAKLQSDGVTTVFCGCDPIIPVFLSGVAARQGYFPEFIVTGTALTDQDIVGQLWNQQFAAHALGISPNAAPVPSTQTLGYAAYKTVRSDEPAFVVDLVYYQMAELAIGLQMAGPDLTPATFQNGMRAYPPAVGPAGLWDFAPGNFTIGEDVQEICWNPKLISTYNNKQGAYTRPVAARWRFGQIPKGRPDCPVPA